MRSNELYLSDIVQAADSIAQFVTGMDEEQFVGNDLVRSAVLHNWRDPVTFDRRLQEINRQPAGAEIRLAMRSVAARSIEATASFSLADGATGHSGLQGVLVLYEDRLSSSVQRGENRGALLQHDRVVRFWSPPLPLRPGRTAQSLRQTLPLAGDWNPARLGLAAFVQDVRSGKVLQAVSLPGCIASQH